MDMAGGGRMNRVTAVMMMVVVVVMLVVPECKGQQQQQQPCPRDLSSTTSTGECCVCTDRSLLCRTACPPRYKMSNDLAVCLPTTTTATATATAPNLTPPTPPTTPTTTPPTPPTPPPPTSPPPSQLLRCLPCHATCSSCNGTRAEDCITCTDNHHLQALNNGTTRCLRQNANTNTTTTTTEDSSSQVGGIVGGAVAAAVVVGVVVVAGWWWWRRRRGSSLDGYPKRSISTLMGSRPAEGAVSSSSSSSHPAAAAVVVAESASDVETGEAGVKTEKTSKVQSLKDPTYVNVQTTVPKLEAIERARDQVLRYTRDPTVKATAGQGHTPKTKQKPSTGAPEDEEELASLPAAPKPPGQDPALAPPQVNYEIVDTPFPAAAQPRPPAPTLTRPEPEPAPALEGPTESYEVMEFPVSPCEKSRTSGLHTRSGLLKTGLNEQKRNTTAGLHAPSSSSFLLSSLPNPGAPVSCPDLPRFPIEEHREKKALRKLIQSQQKTQPQPQPQPPPPPPPPPPHTYADLEEPEDDYVNVGSRKTKKKKEEKEEEEARPQQQQQQEEEEEASDPGEDYENSGTPKKMLLPRAHAPEPSSTGVDNPAAEVVDEELYGNQAMVEAVKNPLYRNTLATTSQARAGTPMTEQTPVSGERRSDVSEQPTYGNQVADGGDGKDGEEDEEEDGDPAYQNCPPRRPQS